MTGWMIFKDFWVIGLGKSWENLKTGNHGFYHSIWGCPVNFPVNQSNKTGGYPWISMTMITRIGFWDDYG